MTCNSQLELGFWVRYSLGQIQRDVLYTEGSKILGALEVEVVKIKGVRGVENI